MAEVLAQLAIEVGVKGLTATTVGNLTKLQEKLVLIEGILPSVASKMNLFAMALQGTLTDAKALSAALPNLNKGLDSKASVNATKYATALGKIASNAADAAQNLDKIPKNLPFAKPQTGGGAGGGGAAGGAVKGYLGISPGGVFAGAMLNNVTPAMTGMVMAGQAAFGILSSLGGTFKELAADALQSGMAIEAARSALTAVTGSTAGADRELNSVIATAKKFAVPIEQAALQYSRLMAAAGKNEGLKTAAKDTFESVMMASRVLSLSAEQTGGVLQALEQIMSKGKLQSEELRKQLGNRLPGAFRIAAESMGISTAELDKRLKLGKISAEEFFAVFSKGLDREFSGGLTNAMTTLSAMRTQMENMKTLLGAEVSKQFLAPFEKASTAPVIGALDNILAKLQDERTTKGTEAMTTLGYAWGTLKADTFTAAAQMFQSMAQTDGVIDDLAGLLRDPKLTLLVGVATGGAGIAPFAAYQREKLKKEMEAQQRLMAPEPEGPTRGMLVVGAAGVSYDVAQQTRNKRRQDMERIAASAELSEKAAKKAADEIERQARFVEQLSDKWAKLLMVKEDDIKLEIERAKLSPARKAEALAIAERIGLYEKEKKAAEEASKTFALGASKLRLSDIEALMRDKPENPPAAWESGGTKFLKRLNYRDDSEDQAFAMLQERLDRMTRAEREWMENHKRNVSSTYRAIREMQEDTISDIGNVLSESAFVQNSRELEELWKGFGRTMAKVLMDMVVKLNIVNPLLDKMRDGGGTGGTNWLSSLLTFGSQSSPGTIMGNNGPMSTIKMPQGGPGGSGPITISIVNNGDGTLQANTSSSMGAGTMARDFEQAVIGVVTKYSRTGGYLAMRGSR